MKIGYVLIICILLCCSSKQNLKEFSQQDNNFFNALKQNDIKLSQPKEGDWLYQHRKTGQNFEQYKI